MTPPRSASAPVLAIMTGGTSATERRLIEEWVATSDEGRGVTKVIDAESGLADELAQYAEALILPVRVAWLPMLQRDATTSRWSELALMATPRRPASWIQRRLAARDPERQRVLTGNGRRHGPAVLVDRVDAERGGSGRIGERDRIARPRTRRQGAGHAR